MNKHSLLYLTKKHILDKIIQVFIYWNNFKYRSMFMACNKIIYYSNFKLSVITIPPFLPLPQVLVFITQQTSFAILNLVSCHAKGHGESKLTPELLCFKFSCIFIKKNLKYYFYILPGVCTPFYPANLAPISVNQTFDCLEKKQGPTVWKVLNDVHQSSIFYLHEVHMFLSQY